MLIDQFILFLAEASQFPQVIWEHNYRMARKSFLADLVSIQTKLNQKVISAKKFADFIDFLGVVDFSERQLAEGFFSLGEILNASGVKDPRVEEYQRLAERFLKRVLGEERFANVRANLKKSLSSEEQQEYDTRLFQNEGLSYCLLYYLTFYKTLTGLESTKEKNAFILKPEINLGFGSLPGIKADFMANESLEKFIILILDDQTRTILLRDYYTCKQVIVKTRNYVEVECAVHEFLYWLLLAFDTHDIMLAANAFFAPYGNDATIKKVLSLFEIEYAPKK